ncbi:MAG: doubled motif LPXTG anchor domain-containing protein, partial [Oscillospiraceae bacterium]|nr:doubled motif LPXTG anchor domain-containing protein [Oscillospiraceae bacterium]
TDPTVEVDEPDVPLTDLPEGPDEGVEIDEPDVPLAELPEASDETVEIDGPDVPLSNVPQTGEASTMMFVVVLLACGMGLVYVNTGKRKDNA